MSLGQFKRQRNTIHITLNYPVSRKQEQIIEHAVENYGYLVPYFPARIDQGICFCDLAKEIAAIYDTKSPRTAAMIEALTLPLH